MTLKDAAMMFVKWVDSYGSPNNPSKDNKTAYDLMFDNGACSLSRDTIFDNCGKRERIRFTINAKIIEEGIYI